ncbi:MAG: TIM barrel protein [candidate division NC10 bacterium]|nr:TIM barrel protein [candidate division NC10 bacterium]
MTPAILFSHFPFGKNLDAIRAHVASHHYAGVEWNLENWRVMVPRERRRKLLERFRAASGFCSVHAPYTDWEIGHRDAEFAAASLRLLREYVDIAADLGAHHVTIHVGAFGLSPEELSWDTLLRNLTGMLEHGARRKTPVTVENLRRGLTSEPETFSALLRATGAPVTFDHGHACGSAWVQEGKGSIADLLGAIPTTILASHLYLIEREDTHCPPQEVAEMSGALTLLRNRGCDFWVLELMSQADLEQTRRVVDAYLAS